MGPGRNHLYPASFRADGSLLDTSLVYPRLRRLLAEADRRGMVVIVMIWYHRRHLEVPQDAAVLAATRAFTVWLRATGVAGEPRVGGRGARRQDAARRLGPDLQRFHPGREAGPLAGEQAHAPVPGVECQRGHRVLTDARVCTCRPRGHPTPIAGKRRRVAAGNAWSANCATRSHFNRAWDRGSGVPAVISHR